jgi:Multiubiquitin
LNSFNITVNRKPVAMSDHRVTGLQVKQAAIVAGVDIELDFQLSIRRSNGKLEVIDDDEKVAIDKDTHFRAVAPDDNS